MSGSSTPFKDAKEKEKNISEIDKTQRALSELSLNKGNLRLKFSYQRHSLHNAYTER
jgi:hypothetical protein